MLDENAWSFSSRGLNKRIADRRVHGYSKRAHNDAKTGTTEGNGVLLTAHMTKGMPYS